MGFTVVHQGEAKGRGPWEYQLLLGRHLLQGGLSFDNVPRIPGKDAVNGWLYVWDCEAEAEAFAAELRRRTRDRAWEVQAVKAKPSWGPLRPIQVEVGRQGDGWVFGLEPLTRMALQARYPGSCRHHRVFISSETEDEFLHMGDGLRDLVRQVLFILTGLSAEQMESFGGFNLVDPVEQKELVSPSPIRRLNAG